MQENVFGGVQTVTGEFAVEALGRTLVHEHVIADISALFVPPRGDHTSTESAAAQDVVDELAST